MKMRRLAPILLAGALVGSSCGTELAGDLEAPEGEATTVASSPSARMDLPTRLAVIESGAQDGPTIVLSGQVPDGASWSGTFLQEMNSTVDGQPSPPVPLIEMGLDMTVEQLDDDRWQYLASYSSIEVVDSNGAPAEAVEQTLELMRPLADLVVRTEVDQFGLARSTEIDGLDGLDPMLRGLLEPLVDQFGDMAVPMPNEPLGIGATWTDSFVLEAMGMTTTTETTYVLTDINGTGYTLETSSVQTQTGAGVVSSTGTSTGTIVGDVAEPLPLRSEVNSRAVSVFSNGVGEQRIEFEISMVIEGS